jgi:hypothetical protein
MLYHLAGITSILVIILLVSSLINVEGADEVNRKARVNNNCDVKKQVSLQDPATGITYTIAFCDNTCEHGFPHTVNEAIMMIPEGYSKERLHATIEHEKIHLLQRRHPEIWKGWYKTLWSYTIQANVPTNMPPELVNKRRYNPDTNDKPFACWRGRYWSLSIYTSMNPGSIAEVRTVWWDQQTGQVSEESPPEWADFFGQQPQDEHPHEMAAQMIANGAGNKNRSQELIAVYEKHFYLKDRR